MTNEFKKWFAARARNPDRITLEEAYQAGLHAKITEMEKQEPVAWMGRGPRDGRIEFSVDKPSPSVIRDFNMIPLYALPGTKGE